MHSLKLNSAERESYRWGLPFKKRPQFGRKSFWNAEFRRTNSLITIFIVPLACENVKWSQMI